VTDGRDKSDIEPIEQLKLARDREKIERDERRSLEQRATTMLAVTVALAALSLNGLRLLVDGDHGPSDVALWAVGPLLYLIFTVIFLLRALTVSPPEPISTPVGEDVSARLTRAEARSEAIATNNFEVLSRVRVATQAFAIGFVVLVLYAGALAVADAG